MRFPYHGAGIGLIYKNSLLIGKRTKKPFIGKWCIPGGGREKESNETILENAERELYEETAIKLCELENSFICSWSLKVPFFSWTSFYYEIFDLPVIIPDEFSELKFIEIENLGNYKFRPFMKFEINKIKNGMKNKYSTSH